eukprot:jgi/Chlat1/3891/Chrsp26S04175
MDRAGEVVEEDGEVDPEEAAEELEAWERQYADERSWELLEEDEDGRLRPLDRTALQRERRRRLQEEAPTARVRKGMIRYLYVVLDLSRAVAETDFRPSRLSKFIVEFFDQNPLSQLGLIVTRNGVAEKLTELSASPGTHSAALTKGGRLDAGGDASLQNALEAARGSLSQIPSYGHREVLVLFSALTTCDPGDLMATMEACKQARCRCSVVGLAAEMYVCKKLTEVTGGVYGVAMNEDHLTELLMAHAPPPPALADSAPASLVHMGFPQRQAEGGAPVLWPSDRSVRGGGYACPRCRTRVWDLPTQCPVCAFTLVSSPHLARSYHHLFPVPRFSEVKEPAHANTARGNPVERCFGCRQPFGNDKAAGLKLLCPQCSQRFCFDCDAYIHESLHNCPGCECMPALATMSARTAAV